MYKIELEAWEQQSGHYIQQGRKIKNFDSGKTYSIETLTETDLFLRQIPFFKKEQGETLEMGYDELFKWFKEGLLLIEGFENGQVKELEIAINNVAKKIKIEKNKGELLTRDEELQELREEKRIRLEADEKKRKEEEELRLAAEEAQRKKTEQKRLKEEEEKKQAEELKKRKQNASSMQIDLISRDLNEE